MENAYMPPQADLKKDDQGIGPYGSVESAKSGDWDFAIGETISEAWSLVKGTKGSFFLAGVIYILIVMIVTQVPLYFMAPSGISELILTNVLNQVLNMLLAPLMIGVTMMGVRRSLSKDISFSQMFEYYPKLISILLMYLAIAALVIIGLFLLIIPGIYLSISYSFAMILMLDKDMGIWEAMETSRKAVTKHWFKVFGFFFVMGLILIVSLIPLGFGSIWTMPLMFIGYGVLYRNIFGVSSAGE